MIESGLVKQGLVKKGLVTALQNWASRYFRRNEDPSYATHSSVTVDRIVMVVLPNTGNGNLGLPTGAPAVNDNELQTIDFAYSGSISELYRNGTDYFEGIIANVKYYLSGELIHSWSINSNSSAETDSVGGLVLTIIDGNAENWGLFDKQADGDWLGQELVVQPINLLNDWANVGGGLIQTENTWNTSATGGIRITSPLWGGGVSVRLGIEAYADSSDFSVKDSLTGQGADPTIATITANTQMSAEVDYVTMNGGLYFRSAGETEGNELFSLSVKEVLKNA